MSFTEMVQQEHPYLMETAKSAHGPIATRDVDCHHTIGGLLLLSVT
jgi:hypothetical protein